jgi:hypothetical protein
MKAMTSRRTLLTTAAALLATPATAFSIDQDHELLQLVPVLDDIFARQAVVLDDLERAETWYYAWKRRNPQPEMRWPEGVDGGDLKAWLELPDPERMRLVAIDPKLNPLYDNDAARDEHEAAMAAWERREQRAEHQAGVTSARAREGEIGAELNRVIDRMKDLPARTAAGLRIKARLADKLADSGLAFSVVEDLLAAGSA